MSLLTYAERLTAAVAEKKASSLEKLCFDLESAQLGKDKWPQEVFDFFIETLSDRQVCAMDGSMSVVRTLYNDFDKLTEEQHALVLAKIDSQADEFGDEMLRHAASDLVARLYPVDAALKLFSAWMRQGTANRLHMAQVGFEVLVMARRLQPREEAKVRSYLEKLWRRID